MGEAVVVKNVHLGRDRVHVSFTRTYNVAKYESVDLRVGYDSDKNSAETIEECFGRVEAQVEGEFEKLCSKVEKKHKL